MMSATPCILVEGAGAASIRRLFFIGAHGAEVGSACWVFDTTDHVWCEAKLGGEWVHLDPCEASLGEPEIYQGLGQERHPCCCVF